MFGLNVDDLVSEYRARVAAARRSRENVAKAAADAVQATWEKIHDTAFWAIGGETTSERNPRKLDGVDMISARVRAAEEVLDAFCTAIKMTGDHSLMKERYYNRMEQEIQTAVDKVGRK